MSSRSQTTSNRDGRGERKRHLILQALIREGGKATTSEIDNHADIGGDLIRYHCDILENKRDPPQVQFVEKDQTGPKHQMPENVYRLTDHGRAAFKAADGDALSLAEAETFAELRSEVVQLRERVAELEDAQNELADHLKRLAEQQ